MASGFHLATRKFPIVYMQNSGFGNVVNPLMSLADPKVDFVVCVCMYIYVCVCVCEGGQCYSL